MKLLWNNTANKTKDSLDKLLATFSTAYEKFEEESISSLVVSLQMGLKVRKTDQHFFISLLESIISILATSEFSIV